MTERVYTGWQADVRPKALASALLALVDDVRAGLYRGRHAQHMVRVTHPDPGGGPPLHTLIILKELIRRTCYDVRGWDYTPGNAKSFKPYSFSGGLCLMPIIRARRPAMLKHLGHGWRVRLIHKAHVKELDVAWLGQYLPDYHLCNERALAVGAKAFVRSNVFLSALCGTLRLYRKSVQFGLRRPRFDLVVSRKPVPAGGASPDPADTLLLAEADETKHFNPPRLMIVPNYARHLWRGRIWLPTGLIPWVREAARYRKVYFHDNNGVCDGGDVKEPFYDTLRDLMAVKFGLRMLRVRSPLSDKERADLPALLREALQGKVRQRPYLLMAVNLKVT